MSPVPGPVSPVPGPGIDAAYNVRHTVSPEVFDQVMIDYRTASDRAVADLPGHRDVIYDEASAQRLDVWGTPGPGAGLRPVFIAIHGGYWRALSRHDAAFMAGVLNEASVATVTVDYGLAPATQLREIVRQVRAAVAWVYHHGAARGLDPRRIVVGGSSAGGHLTAATMVPGWQRDFGLPANVVRAALPISGLFDLRPLVGSFTDEWLDLTADEATALSPAVAVDGAGAPPRAVVAVAEHDGDGFREQSRAFHAQWARRADSALLIVPERNHYDVFLDLADPNSALTRALLDLVAGTADHS